jgi:hypothetical protein
MNRYELAHDKQIIDWGLSRSPSSMGESMHSVRSENTISMHLFRADLVPVFSFGENDVSDNSILILSIVNALCSSDIQPNAEREGHHNIRSAEEIPEYVWIHTSALSWTWSTEL